MMPGLPATAGRSHADTHVHGGVKTLLDTRIQDATTMTGTGATAAEYLSC
jgi:hypothetical protein